MCGIRNILDYEGARNDGAAAGQTRDAIQRALDELAVQNGGTLYFPEGTYAIDRPLTIWKEDANPDLYNNWTHIVGRSAIIRKADTFTGDRLLTIWALSGDEDSILIEGIVFQGDEDRDVNGVDWWAPTIDYRAKNAQSLLAAGTDSTRYTKNVHFSRCIFTFCYIGARVTGNSNSFVQCQFRGNRCGAFLTHAANDIKFIACSFRVGNVGADITTIRQGAGTIGAGFTDCIFESNDQSGIRLNGAQASIHSGCFEANGIIHSQLGKPDRYGHGHYDLSDQEVAMRMGAAIHLEQGSFGAAALTVSGTYFANERMLANTLQNCFIECKGGLTVIPRKYSAGAGERRACAFGPSTFFQGPVKLDIHDDLDVFDLVSDDRRKRFTLNDEQKLLTASTRRRYIDAPLQDLAVSSPRAEYYHVNRCITRRRSGRSLMVREGPHALAKDPFSLDLVQLELSPQLTHGMLEIAVAMWGELLINGRLARRYASTIRRRFSFFRTSNGEGIAFMPESPAEFCSAGEGASSSEEEFPAAMFAEKVRHNGGDDSAKKTAAPGLALLAEGTDTTLRVNHLQHPLAVLPESELPAIGPKTDLDQAINYHMRFALDISLSGHSLTKHTDRLLRFKEYKLQFAPRYDSEENEFINARDLEGVTLEEPQFVFLCPICPPRSSAPLNPGDPSIQSVRFLLTGQSGPVTEFASTAVPYAMSLATTGLAGGHYEISAQVLDNKNNIITETSARFRVSNSALRLAYAGSEDRSHLFELDGAALRGGVYPVLEIPRTFWEEDGRETYPAWEVWFYLDGRHTPPQYSYPPDEDSTPFSADETAAYIDFRGTRDGEGKTAIPWNTTGVVNGRHTITARIVREGTEPENLGRLVEIFHEVSATFRINNRFALTYCSSSRGDNPIHERLEGAQVSGTITIFTEILCQADPHISGITLKLDGTAVESASGEWIWDTTEVTNGLHTIEVGIVADRGTETATAVFSVHNH